MIDIYIYEKIGGMQLYKQIQKLMKEPKFKEELKWLQQYRSTNAGFQNEKLKLKKKQLPIYQEINALLREAQKTAEAMLLDERPDIAETIHNQIMINEEMGTGNVPEAARIQREALEKEKLFA